MIDIDERFIDISENTRSGDKVREIHKVILHDVPLKYEKGIKNRNYINNLKYQDEIFMSYHYIIDQSGKILQLIPEDEISLHTKYLEFDLYSISIALCYDKNSNSLTKETLNSLFNLTKSITANYNLNFKYDILLCYNVINKRSPIFFVENPYIFYEYKNQKLFCVS